MPDDPSQQVHFSVSVKTDRDRFLRRTCPSCGRDFKTEANPADLQWELEAYCRRSGLEIGEPAQAAESAAAIIRCPYCADQCESSQSFTEETVEYLKRILYREFVLPQINGMFSGLEDSFGSPRSTGGMVSMSVEFKHTPVMRPVRPIHGPDSAEFTIVTFLCCGKKLKVSEGWFAPDICSFCGTEVAVI